MNKKKIFKITILIIVFALIIFVIKVISSKRNDEFCATLAQDTIDVGVVEVKGNTELMHIDADTVTGKKIDENSSELSLDLQAVRESSNFIPDNKKEKLVVRIEDEEGKKVREYDITTNEKDSEWFFINKGCYSISIVSKKSEGVYKLSIDNYKLF